jgi:fermentation-respiration switch protein FrsA (DUF1100 family)
MPTALSLGRRYLSWRSLIKVAAGVASLYLLAIGILVAFEDRFIFHPVPAAQRWSGPPSGFAAQDVNLISADGTLISGRWFPRAGAAGAVLICHGQAGNLSLECGPRQLTGWQEDIGVSVFIFDYPGYGRSGGSPSEDGCYAAATAALNWLIVTQQLPPEQVLIYGRSLGTGVAVDLASRSPHRALVLVNPYTSLPDVASRRFCLWPAHLVMRNRFPSAAKIGNCSGPTLIVHGTDDNLIPYALGRELYEAANEPKRFLSVEGGRHSGGLPTAFFPTLHDFLGDVEAEALR